MLDENGVAKIGDFGLVADEMILGYAKDDEYGYPDHLAPEAWNTGITSIKTDIWAFGMTIYRLLHGKTWYSQNHLSPNLIPKGGYANKLIWLPHVPKPWHQAIKKMMHDNTRIRLQTVDQVLHTISKLPTPIDWKCEVLANETSWFRVKGNRTIRVVWTWESSKKSNWKAWSEPTNGNGNKRTLNGSKNVQTKSQSERQLIDYFNT